VSLVGIDPGIVGRGFMNVKHEAEEKSRRRRALEEEARGPHARTHDAIPVRVVSRVV
jgi:hypothetical protein